MLGVLLAALALAVGIAGLGDVDLWRDEALASALIEVVCAPSPISSLESNMRASRYSAKFAELWPDVSRVRFGGDIRVVC